MTKAPVALSFGFPKFVFCVSGNISENCSKVMSTIVIIKEKWLKYAFLCNFFVQVNLNSI